MTDILLNEVKEQGVVKMIEEQSKSMFDDITEKAKKIANGKDMIGFKAFEWEDGYNKAKEYVDNNQDNIEDWSLIDKHDDIMYLVLQLEKVDNPNNFKHMMFIPFEMMGREEGFPLEDGQRL